MGNLIRITSYILVLTCSLYSGYAYAVLGDFKKQIEKMGFVSNISNPEVINDQRAGFLTGGSATIRGNVGNAQLASIQLPSFKAGCGGIDLFGGGLGYLNARQLTELLRNIPQNLASYALLLAIDSLSPEMGNLTKGLEAAARFINSQNINSCQLSASMMAGAWPKNEASQRLACQSRNMGSNAVSDFFTARHSCSGDEMAATNRDKKSVYDLDSLLGSEYNLVWKALKDKGISDKHTINTLMSISGTYISRIVNGKIVAQFKPSLASRPELIDAFMHGSGSTQLYSCVDSECLDVKLQETNITAESSLMGKIENLIESIAGKIRSEHAGIVQDMTEEEKNLVKMSAYPIIPMVRNEVSRRGGKVALSINEHIEGISFDIAINYIDEMLTLVYRAVTELQSAQFDGSLIDNFRQEMREVRRYLQNHKQIGISRTRVIYDVKKRTDLLSNQIRTVFGEYNTN